VENLNFIIKSKKFTTEPLKVGNLIDLWKMRSVLSMGNYGNIYRMGFINADDALMIIDIEAFFTVFCPDFIQSLKPGSIRDLGVEDYIEIRDVYTKDILPWLEKVETVLKKKNDA